MKISVSCKFCSHQFEVDINYKRFMTDICPNEHKNIFVIQSQLFEILFDLGCISLINNEYREAIFNWSSSLERFREFFIKFSLFKKGKGKEINKVG